jgi:hypothetical protein
MGMARAQVADREIAEKAAAADQGGKVDRPPMPGHSQENFIRSEQKEKKLCQQEIEQDQKVWAPEADAAQVFAAATANPDMKTWLSRADTTAEEWQAGGDSSDGSAARCTWDGEPPHTLPEHTRHPPR